MKTTNSLLRACILSLFVLSGCNTSTVESDSDAAVNDMYSEMVYYSSLYSASVNEQLSLLKTKASDNEVNVSSIDISSIDEKYIEYINIYTEPDDVSQWDEMAVFRLVNSDTRFSDEEKCILVKSIAGAFYLKNTFSSFDSVVYTKANEEACLKQFKKDMKRATRNAGLALVAALLEPTALGETLALVYYYYAIDDAQQDYNDCMAQ